MVRALVWISVLLAVDDGAAVREALAALQRGDFAAAERVLRPEVKAHPGDAGALTLLGVALDKQGRYKEAEEVHRRASEAVPKSPDVWNNYANHALATGDEDRARGLYLRVIALAPDEYNANVQLARLALKKRNGAEAWEYCRHLPDSPNLAPLRLDALRLAGVGAAEAGDFKKAETFFTQALSLAPADFNLLSNLGVVAWNTGHYQRAREVLEAARRQQPQNVDVLYTLATVEQADRHAEAAVPLLAQASRLAPARADIQKLLALATGDLGALADSAAAWDRYLKLQPGDDVARRERGFTAFQMGQFEQGVAELRGYAAKHPDDAVGHFELGAAENKDDPAQALKEYDRALALKSDFAAAHSARGSLYYQMGKPETALPDLEAAAALRPDDAVSLDRLGQTYLALDRSRDAVAALRKAAALAPGDSKTQLHLARALADAGQAAESKAAMDRFRQLGPAVNKAVPGGLVDYLSLTPEQRRADYRARVERVAREHPEDAAAEVAYLRLLLEDGEAARAAEVARRIVELKPPAAVLADAGRALLEARDYQPAAELLRQAPPGAGVELDLAVAAFHASGPADGIRLLDRIAEPERSGPYYLARAEMLDAAGRNAESSAALEQALRAPAQSNLYLQAGTFLLRRGNSPTALQVSEAAAAAFPQDREILLLRAVALEQAGRTKEAEALLEQLQNRWPEWAAGWVAHAIVAAKHGQDASPLLRTALALGAHSTEVKAFSESGQVPSLTALFLEKNSRNW